MVRTRSANAIVTIQKTEVRMRDQVVGDWTELEVMRWDHLYMIRRQASKVPPFETLLRR